MSPFAAALLASISALLGVQVFAAATGRAAQRRSGPRKNFLLAVLVRLRRLLPGLVGALERQGTSEAIARAGLGDQLTVRDVAAARVAGLLVALLLAPRVASMLPPRMLLIVLPAMLWAAAQTPLLLLARRGARRAAAMRAALPDALDLLCACLVAGLALRRSLALVAAHCAEPVAGEFAHVATETAYGSSQATALEGLLRRNPHGEVRALVAAIGQAERNGSPLAPVVAAQARDARQAFNRALVEQGAHAGPKIQLIVSATIVPGALIAFAAIVIAAIARGEIKLL
jgi:Flp pilus assembly protein TadB